MKKLSCAAAAAALLVGCGGGVRPAPGGTGSAPPPTYVEASVYCPNYAQAVPSVGFPGDAVAANLRAGQVVVEIVAGRGANAEIRVVRATHAVFVPSAVQAARRLECRAAPLPIRLTADFNNGGD